MAERTLHSGSVQFIDTTDTSKIDIHVSANLPTVQIYSTESENKFTPNWENNNLILVATVWADSVNVTDNATYQWYKHINTDSEGEPIGSPISGVSGSTLTIATNELNPEDEYNKNISTIRYRCEATYNNKPFSGELSFAKILNGTNGSDGSPAPAVQARYSVDGTDSNLSAEFNPAIHKYIHFSYDGGNDWEHAIKIVGDDGTSVRILGSYDEETQLPSSYLGDIGDGYIVGDNLHIWNGSSWQNVGNIRGPKGDNGISYYMFIRYADDTSGTGMSTSPAGKKYIGFHRNTTNIAPTDRTFATWNWAKFVGEDAKSISLTASSQVFKTTEDGTTPQTITVTGLAVNTTITSWSYNTDGATNISGELSFSSTLPTGVTRSGNVVTIDRETPYNSIIIKASGDGYSDYLTIYKVSDGSTGAKGDDGTPASIAFLTNESISFVADANGQVDETTVYCNAAAYTGAEAVTPTIDVEHITGVPNGMTIGEIEVVDSINELRIPIHIADNADLGSASSTNGILNIPVLSPIAVNLKLNWNKINTGRGIASVTEYYALSNSKTTAPSSWLTTMPTTDSTSKYLWNYELITYTDGSTEETNPVVIGVYGEDGKGISSIVNYYLATNLSSGVTKNTQGWTENIQLISSEMRYLWNYETINYTKGSSTTTEPVIIGVYGVGVDSVTVTYGVSSSASTQPTSWQSSVPVAAEGSYLWTRTITDYTDATTPDTVTYTYAKQGEKGNTGAPGGSVTVSSIQYQAGTSATTAPTGTWSNSVVSVAEGSFLWTKTTFSDGKVAYGVAKQGTSGTPASLVQITPSAMYFKSTTGKDGVFTPDYIYLYPRFQNCTFRKWQYSVDGGITWSDLPASSGVSVGTQISNGVSVLNTLTISSTSSLYTDDITSISFKCLTTNDNIYDIVSIAKIYDVVDLQIGGNNLAYGLGGAYTDKNRIYAQDRAQAAIVTLNGKTWIEYIAPSYNAMRLVNLTNLEEETDYTWSFDVYTTGTDNFINATNYGANIDVGTGSESYGPSANMEIGQTKRRLSFTFNTGRHRNTILHIVGLVAGDTYYFADFQLQKGNKATDWSPTTEDILNEAANVNVMLSNEAHFFVANSDGVPTATNIVLDVIGYKGSIQSPTTVGTISGLPSAGMTATVSNNNTTNTKITVVVTTALTSSVADYGTLTIPVTVNGKVINKIFSWSKSKAGVQGGKGDSASLVKINPSALYFKSTTGNDGVFTPQYIYLYPTFQNATYSNWQYSINGGTSWVAASGANGLSISTYNTVANVLRIDRASTLFTDTVTSISFRCNTTTNNVYDTVSIAKIYDVVDIKIGGKNLLRDSTFNDGSSWHKGANIGQIIAAENDKPNSKIYHIQHTNTGTVITSSAIFNTQRTFVRLKPGESIAVSYDFYADDLNKVGSIISTLRISTAATGGTVTSLVNLNKANIINDVTTSKWNRISHVYTATENLEGWLMFGLYMRSEIGGAVDCKYREIKVEYGNKATDWTPAPEDTLTTTFQLYAPQGHLITSDIPQVTLQAFAYEGSREISDATFKWYRWSNEAWVEISGVTGKSLSLAKSDIMKVGTYKCDMTYKGKVYTATETIEDKTDIYDSLITVNAKRSNNSMYWILYTKIYSEDGERDTLLGPISETAPTNPTTGVYWYQIDTTNYSVTLKKYSGSEWTTTTDKQELLYDWMMFRDIPDMISIGNRGKVVIVKNSDFSGVCSVQCEVFDNQNTMLSRNNQILNDPTDPIISDTAPTNPIDGQMWIKIDDNNTYVLSVWNQSQEQWITSNADSQNKIHVSKPEQYTAGDVWIVGGDYSPIVYINGIAQTTRHLAKTMLRATASSQTYSDVHWVEALNYTEKLDSLSDTVNKLTQVLDIDETGLIMQAISSSGTVSAFKTKLTNTELGFYQGEDKVAYINNNQLNISKAEITHGLNIGGSLPQMRLGNFVFIQESNGSLSIG